MEGKKFDDGKPRMDLIPGEWLEEIAKVLTYGAEKYEEESWRKVPNGEKRYLAAAMRHLVAAKKGIENGGPEWQMSDDGFPALVQAAVNCLFILSIQSKKEEPCKDFYDSLTVDQKVKLCCDICHDRKLMLVWSPFCRARVNTYEKENGEAYHG